MTIPLIPVSLPPTVSAAALSGNGQGAEAQSKDSLLPQETFRAVLNHALGSVRVTTRTPLARVQGSTTVAERTGDEVLTEDTAAAPRVLVSPDVTTGQGAKTTVRMPNVAQLADATHVAASVTMALGAEHSSAPVHVTRPETAHAAVVPVETSQHTTHPESSADPLLNDNSSTTLVKLADTALVVAAAPPAGSLSGAIPVFAAEVPPPSAEYVALSEQDANDLTRSLVAQATEIRSTLPLAAAALRTPLPVATPAKDPTTLHPEFRARLDRVVDQMEALGYSVTVVETGRSQARQDFLWAQGRERPGPVVTWTRASLHTQGLAADVQLNGTYSDAKAYAALANVARSEGLRTLGATDPGHVELPRQIAAAYAPVRSVDAVAAMPPVPSRATLAVGDVSAAPVRVASVNSQRPVNSAVSNTSDVTARINALHAALADAASGANDALEGPQWPTRFVAAADRSVPGTPTRYNAPTAPIMVPKVDTVAMPLTAATVAPVAAVATVAATAQVARVAQPAVPGESKVRRNIMQPAASDRPHVTSVSSPIALPAVELPRVDTPAIHVTAPLASDDAIVVTPFTPIRIDDSSAQTSAERAPAVQNSQRMAVQDDRAPSAARLATEPDVHGASETVSEYNVNAVDGSTQAPDAELLISRSSAGAAADVRREGIAGTPHVGIDPSERIARVLRLQEGAREQSLSSVVLRVDAPGGGEDRIRVDLRGQRVDAVLNMSDASSADQLRQHASELTASLAQSGLESEGITIRTAQRVSDATQSLSAALGGASERDGMRTASGSSSSQNNSQTPQRDTRQSTRHEDNTRDSDRQQPRQRRQPKGE